MEGTFAVGDEVLDELADRQVAPRGDADRAELPLLSLIGAAVAGAALLAGGAVAVSRLRGRHSGSG